MKKIILLALLCNFVDLFSFEKLEKVAITGLDGRGGFYNLDTKTASLDSMGDRSYYSDIVEYSHAVTPPNVANPELKPFATMTNPKYKASAAKMGGQTKMITLYGIEQVSTEVDAMPIPGVVKISKKVDSVFRIYGSTGQYDAKVKIAYLFDVNGEQRKYTHVVEYSQAVTPPNIGNPNLKPFATMPNPRYKETDKHLAGGQFKTITLYGIEEKDFDTIQGFLM